MGNDFRLTQHRGEVLHLLEKDSGVDPEVIVTVHPSSILRGPVEERDEAFAGLVADLRFAEDVLRSHQGPSSGR